jgi:hypothetical protein
MPVSAYDAEGRLKKHALAGTSLAVDPSREAQRRQFGELYEEAKTDPAGGREAMLSRLSERYGDYEKQQASRLAEIASRKSMFDKEVSGLRDPALEESFERYKDTNARDEDIYRWRESHMPAEMLDEAKKKFEGMTWEERRAWAQESIDPSVEGADLLITPSVTPERGDALKALKNVSKLQKGDFRWDQVLPSLKKKAPLSEKKYWEELGGVKLRQYYGGKMAKQLYREQYAGKEAAYLKKISDEVERINEQYIPLQEEEYERTQRLQDRVELYNMFLGG